MPNDSRALPAYCYGDPASIAEANELKEMGCKACKSHKVVFDRVVCKEPRMTQSKKVPYIGSKCKYFILEEVS